MATILSNGTMLYGVVDDAIFRFECFTALDLGQDTYSKIAINCLDSKVKRSRRGSVEIGEGSITFQIEDDNPSHAKLFLLVESGEEIDFYLGSGESDDAPTIAVDEVTLPTTRTWVTFSAYLNGANPTIEEDGVWTYAFPLIRTSEPTLPVLRST